MIQDVSLNKKMETERDMEKEMAYLRFAFTFVTFILMTFIIEVTIIDFNLLANSRVDASPCSALRTVSST